VTVLVSAPPADAGVCNFVVSGMWVGEFVGLWVRVGCEVCGSVVSLWVYGSLGLWVHGSVVWERAFGLAHNVVIVVTAFS
jgi:hypothetical protein